MVPGGDAGVVLGAEERLVVGGHEGLPRGVRLGAQQLSGPVVQQQPGLLGGDLSQPARQHGAHALQVLGQGAVGRVGIDQV